MPRESERFWQTKLWQMNLHKAKLHQDWKKITFPCSSGFESKAQPESAEPDSAMACWKKAVKIKDKSEVIKKVIMVICDSNSYSGWSYYVEKVGRVDGRLPKHCPLILPGGGGLIGWLVPWLSFHSIAWLHILIINTILLYDQKFEHLYSLNCLAAYSHYYHHLVVRSKVWAPVWWPGQDPLQRLRCGLEPIAMLATGWNWSVFISFPFYQI